MTDLQTNNYKNNPLLKRVGIKHKYTNEQIEELIKCKQDYKYFIKKYCKIVSLDSEDLIDFSLFEYQERFLDAVNDNRRVISMQPRQSGKTTVIGAYLCWYAVFHANQTIAILANNKETANEILSRVKLMYEYLPHWIQHGVKKWNEGSIDLENGSKMFTRATSKSGIRGRSCNLLYIDEASIIPNNIAEAFFTAIYPVISAGKKTKVIITSTPLGYNHFWHYWTEAENGKNGFIPIRVHYWEHPDRDEQWAREQKELLGELKFNQEILCQFLGSSATLLNGDTLSKLIPLDGIFEKDDLVIYEMPEENSLYMMTVDTAEGIGGDYSTFSVIKISETPYKLVAKYRNNLISQLLFPDLIHQIGKQFNDAYVLIEIDSVGKQVAQILYDDLEYENLLMVGQKNKSGQFLSIGNDVNYGVKMSKQVKRIGCRTLKTLMEENKMIIHDKDIITEFATFIEKRGTFMADETYHDDLIMTLVIFAWASQDAFFKDLTNIDSRKVLFDKKIKEIENDVLPTGFYFNGLEDEIKEIEDIIDF